MICLNEIYVNENIIRLSLSYPHRDSIPFNLSYGLAELSQVQDCNVDGGSSSLKHEIGLKTQLEKFCPDDFTDDYQVNFIALLLKESSTASSSFKLRFAASSTDDFRIPEHR